jgi:hypothetical protein
MKGTPDVSVIHVWATWPNGYFRRILIRAGLHPTLGKMREGWGTRLKGHVHFFGL